MLTKILKFCRSNWTNTNKLLFYNDVESETVTQYNNLGFTFSSGVFIYKKKTELDVAKANVAVGVVLSSRAKARVVSWEDRVKLYEVIAISSLLYAV